MGISGAVWRGDESMKDRGWEEWIFDERVGISGCGLWVWGRECRMVVCSRSWCLVLCGVLKRGKRYDVDESCDVKWGEVDEISEVLLDFAKHWSWLVGEWC